MNPEAVAALEVGAADPIEITSDVVRVGDVFVLQTDVDTYRRP